MLEREKDSEFSEEALEKKRLEEEERKKTSHEMVAESIRRELAESMLKTHSMTFSSHLKNRGKGS